MIGIVAPTDYGWYEFLLDRSLPEVNFWTPTDTRPLRAPEFSPFFFKLKKPHYAICGFGYFARWSSLPDWLAWDCFREGNGCTSFTEMQERIGKIRRGIGYRSERSNSNIGCILIVQPVFFPPDAWVRQPADWGKTTVTPTRYDLTTGEGRRIWEECQDRAAVEQLISSSDLLTVRPPRARYGAPQLTTPRLGQGTFRVAVTDAYGRACSVTEEHSLPALEAAHIRSYAHDGPHEVRNGILLRADLHRLFDKGYITVDRDYRLEVSDRLRQDFSNGRSYYPLRGKPLSLPTNVSDHPARDYLEWHNQHVYLG